MVFTAISYCEMSIAFPISGSVYSYAGRGLHPSAGFLAGWAVLLDYLLLPTLAQVHPVRHVPKRAVLLVPAVSLALGLFFVGQAAFLSSLVTFGALFSFLTRPARRGGGLLHRQTAHPRKS